MIDVQLTTILFLAFIVEAFVEAFVASWWTAAHLDPKALPMVAALFGIIATVGFHVDMFAGFGLVSGFPMFGQVLTGLVVSRGGDFVHQAYNFMSKNAPATH